MFCLLFVSADLNSYGVNVEHAAFQHVELEFVRTTGSSLGKGYVVNALVFSISLNGSLYFCAVLTATGHVEQVSAGIVA